MRPNHIQLELLIQLRLDAENVKKGLWQQFYGASVAAPPGQAEEWLRKADEVAEVLGWALKDLDKLIEEFRDNG